MRCAKEIALLVIIVPLLVSAVCAQTAVLKSDYPALLSFQKVADGGNLSQEIYGEGPTIWIRHYWYLLR
jgi:hypothetical protein